MKEEIGYPMGDPAAVGFAGENIWQSTGGWNGSVLVRTRKRVVVVG